MTGKNSKKGQGLPLNTIVIAILVVIVLLVIIVFFTTRVGETGNQLERNSDGFAECKVGSILIPKEKYSDANTQTPDSSGNCPTGSDKIAGAAAPEGEICCAVRSTS